VNAAGPDRSASTLFVASHLAICAATWGSSFIFIKLTRGEVDPITLSFIRAAIAATAMAAWVMLLRQVPWPARSEIQDWLVLGSVNGWIPNILVAFALERMAAGMASMVQAATPLFTALFAHMLFADERLTRQRVVGILVGFAGTLLLIGPRLTEGGAETLAVIAMIAVVVCYGSGNIYTRFRRATRPERLALGQQMISAMVSAPLAMAIAGPLATAAAMQAHGWPLFILGSVCTALPILIFMQLITRAGPTKASMTSYLAPATAVMLSVIVLGETLSPWQMAGGAVILVGVAIITLAPAALRRA